MEQNNCLITELSELIESLSGAACSFSGPVPEHEITFAEWDLGVVFPKSYRDFLLQCGSGKVGACKLLGLGPVDLFDDVVMENLLRGPRMTTRYVKFAEDATGLSLHFDTFEMTPDGECPVVVLGAEGAREPIASGFLEFFRKVGQAVTQSRKAVTLMVAGRRDNPACSMTAPDDRPKDVASRN